MKEGARRSLALGLVLLAVLAACLIGSWDGSAAGPALEGIDLDVTFINRSPLYQSYCVDYPRDVPGQPGIPFLCPGTEDDRRWPEPGEVVTFTAHVVNKGTAPSPAFDYAWQIDGVEAATGSLPALAPAEEITATYQWPWGHGLSPDGQRALGGHRVRFTADPANAVPETFESNNTLEDPTSAMSFRIVFTPQMYETYNVPVDPQWPRSAEDWIQKQFAAWNLDFASSTYPVTPQGATVRVRIDKIGVSDTNPPLEGHDGDWFIDADYRQAGGYYDPVTDIDWGLIHELSHMVSLIDLYAIGAAGPDVHVADRLGNPVNVRFDWPRFDVMGGGDIWPHTDHNLYSSHSAGGVSTFQGYRNGYYGSYLFDIPLDNYFLVLDSQGNPAPGVEVALYQRAGMWDWTGAQGFDDVPEISGTTDSGGLFHLTNRSARGGTLTLNGHVLHDNPFGVIDIVGGQNLFLVQLRQGDHEEYRFLDITDLNLAYWMGDTASHTFTIHSHVPPPGAPQAPALTRVQVQGDWARVCWQDSPSPGVTGYRIYRATWPQSEYELAAGVSGGPCWEESHPMSNRDGKTYNVTAVDAQGLESGFSSPGWAPSLTGPASVVVTAEGERTILDPHNGFALIRQGASGAYRTYVSLQHLDLSTSQFVALDANDFLLLSAGDAYSERHSVRVVSYEGAPLFQFGKRGSGPGQLEVPAGVAGWGGPWSYGGPYEVDEHTLLLLHFDGSYVGAQGEVGTAAGTTFQEGRFGQGVLVDDTDTLTYTAAGNWNLTQGSLEFWVRPNWDGADEGYYILFEESTPSNPENLIRVHAGGWLWIALWDSSGGYGVTHGTADWKAGEWHHIAFVWQDPRLALYEDGLLVTENDEGGVPDWLGDLLSVGGGLSWSGYRADAVIDELRISDVPRVGDSDTCGRILVADSGNHRVQAYDIIGQFLSEFGTPGSGEGQFDHPQGLAVGPDGRVIVVDRGNNRLVALSFDGQQFGYLDAYTAGFSEPTGVSVDTRGNLAVADTGNNRVVVLDPQGQFLAEYAEPNDGYSGSFLAPRGVAVDGLGDVVVADTGNQRVVTARGALPPRGRICLPLVRRAD